MTKEDMHRKIIFSIIELKTEKMLKLRSDPYEVDAWLEAEVLSDEIEDLSKALKEVSSEY